MNCDLYFLVVLAQAFADSKPLEALAQAFAEIERLGRLEEFRNGFHQFQRFIAEAYSAQVPTVQLERDGTVLAEVIPCLAIHEVRISVIEPGDYAFRLSTGRVLWTGRIETNDVHWAAAFPTEALPLAADTGDAKEIHTRELRLLHGEIVARVYPGVEHGTIGITIDRWKKPQT